MTEYRGRLEAPQAAGLKAMRARLVAVLQFGADANGHVLTAAFVVYKPCGVQRE